MSRTEKILCVDDSTDTLELLRRNLELNGFTVFTVSSVEEAMRLLENTEVDIVITDMKMPKISGIELVKYVSENYRNTGIMMITGFATIEGAVSAMKTGADEYLAKPFTDEELQTALDKILQKVRDRKMIAGNSEKSGFHGIIGKSHEMQKVFSIVKKAAISNANVLITGESGTGKELVARAIHYQSLRSKSPFIPVNCAAIPEELLESELFGYVKGAFTGADSTRAGFFQTADGGTIFLDEVSEMSHAMQAKLLRVIQEREIMMVGSRKPISVDIRVVCATNKDLHSLVSKKLFREDLFYRLNVINIDLPPLRKREDDIIELLTFFLHKFSREIGRDDLIISESALNILKSYHWPGNVRELENLMQRLTVMAEDSSVEIADLPTYMRSSFYRPNGLDRKLEEVEMEYINSVLSSVNGNKSKAAQILGIDRKTLRTKLKEV
ncbi:MAG: sigma-54 dependent transcriptional regulator [Candidatus Cloacimonetes bacterium]|nr:sigma-54 dependent transcriptional regulator [Candidatus Cloacimonadota bacterium]